MGMEEIVVFYVALPILFLVTLILVLQALVRRFGATSVLVGVSVLPALAACFFLAKATLGVGLVTFSCYLAILARIAQAKKSEAKRSE